MRELAEAKAFLREALNKMQLVQHRVEGPGHATALIHAVLMSLEGNLITIEDIEKCIGGPGVGNV